MKKSVQKEMDLLTKEALTAQEMAAFFWVSDKSSDEDKYWLNGHLNSFENVLNQKDEYNETQTEMAIITLRLTVDAVQMYAESHSELKQEYLYSTNKKDAYKEWLRFYISSDPATELHIIQDRKAAKKFFSLQSQKERVRA